MAHSPMDIRHGHDKSNTFEAAKIAPRMIWILDLYSFAVSHRVAINILNA